MIFNMYGEMLFPGDQWEVLGNRPGHEDGICAVQHLEAKIEMKSRCMVLVDNEGSTSRCGPRVYVASEFSCGLGSLVEGALLGVGLGACHEGRC